MPEPAGWESSAALDARSGTERSADWSLEAAPMAEAVDRAGNCATAPGACLGVVGGTVSALVCAAPGASFAVVGGAVSARCGVACETAGDEYTRARASEMEMTLPFPATPGAKEGTGPAEEPTAVSSPASGAGG